MTDLLERRAENRWTAHIQPFDPYATCQACGCDAISTRVFPGWHQLCAYTVFNNNWVALDASSRLAFDSWIKAPTEAEQDKRKADWLDLNRRSSEDRHFDRRCTRCHNGWVEWTLD